MKIQKYSVRLVKSGVLRVAESATVDCYESAVKVFMALTKDKPHEEIHLILLNGRSEIIGTVMVSMGGLHGAGVTARDILRPVISSGAAAFLMGHNHPSGDPTPSPDDRSMTEHIVKCASLVGTPMLDHIVVAPTTGKHRSVTQ